MISAQAFRDGGATQNARQVLIFAETRRRRQEKGRKITPLTASAAQEFSKERPSFSEEKESKRLFQ
ncbi:hypothetical protein NON00_16865 [Roseomonas sp. GC11]|uniref:hypothetical protein n=1 Tax=Roseomonas sp. GC11 TaxID=2950546 RepID=UPI00210864EA|nr:hypothetical protein [Roseomonas sp. GC11]MCQ4161590.1 hypothetical protein [Roseomonas sp. GC11]